MSEGEGVPYCRRHDVWHVGTCEEWEDAMRAPTAYRGSLSISVKVPDPPSIAVDDGDGQPILTIHSDGRCVLNQPEKADAGARIFADAVTTLLVNGWATLGIGHVTLPDLAEYDLDRDMFGSVNLEHSRCTAGEEAARLGTCIDASDVLRLIREHHTAHHARPAPPQDGTIPTRGAR